MCSRDSAPASIDLGGRCDSPPLTCLCRDDDATVVSGHCRLITPPKLVQKFATVAPVITGPGELAASRGHGRLDRGLLSRSASFGYSVTTLTVFAALS